MKQAIDEWTTAAQTESGIIFRRVNKSGVIHGDSMTPQAIHDVVIEHSRAIGCEVAAHDLHRTFAKLAHKGGSGIDQIQLSLGHASIQTTEKYLGVSQNLTTAPGDLLGLSIKKVS